MTTPVETTRILTRAEDEIIYGVRPPSERGGRLPIFYRDEVEAIRADQRAVAAIARDWGVAIDTIRRVKRRGCFSDFEYIPRDEINRIVTYNSEFERAIGELMARRSRVGAGCRSAVEKPAGMDRLPREDGDLAGAGAALRFCNGGIMPRLPRSQR